MKVAVTSTGTNLESAVDPRFGRCAFFLVIDTDSMKYQAIKNPGVAMGSGAGIQSARMLSETGVRTVLTGNCGPNAFQTLSSAGVEVIIGVQGSVREVTEQFKKGQMDCSGAPNVTSHFGMGSGGNIGAKPIGSPGGRNFMGGGTGRGTGMARGMGMGRGMGSGRGMGMGVGTAGPSAPDRRGGNDRYQQGAQKFPSPEEAIALLKEQSATIEERMREINARIASLQHDYAQIPMTADVDSSKCSGCSACCSACPEEAVTMVKDVAVVNPEKCTACEKCIPVCPKGAIFLRKRTSDE